MWRTGLATILLMTAIGNGAKADAPALHELYRPVMMLWQSLVGTPAPDHEIISPPAGIDPGMALRPPSGGVLRQIEPPQRFRQR